MKKGAAEYAAPLSSRSRELRRDDDYLPRCFRARGYYETAGKKRCLESRSRRRRGAQHVRAREEKREAEVAIRITGRGLDNVRRIIVSEERSGREHFNRCARN